VFVNRFHQDIGSVMLAITLATLLASGYQPPGLRGGTTRLPIVIRTSSIRASKDETVRSKLGPLSSESMDVLFKYGPVVYATRCFDSEEYNESIRKLQGRYPKISRALAEQEIHQFLTDQNGYLAKSSSKSYKGPQEGDLKPPVGLVDKLLVVAWVAILVPVSSTLVRFCLDPPAY
jgi:hypothetical protein